MLSHMSKDNLLMSESSASLVSLNLANKLTIDPKNIDTIENLKKLLGG